MSAVICCGCSKLMKHRAARKAGWRMVLVARLLAEQSSEGHGVKYACSAECLARSIDTLWNGTAA